MHFACVQVFQKPKNTFETGDKVLHLGVIQKQLDKREINHDYGNDIK